MPNCHWYGTLKDHHALVSVIIAQGDVAVMDLYSQPDQPIQSYATADAVIAQCKDTQGLQHFNLWHSLTSPRRDISRGRRNDGTMFERTGAIGFVQFYLAQTSGERLDYSQTKTVSAARMGAKDGLFVDTQGETWDVGATNRYSAWLNRQIKKLAVARFENAYVLPDAGLHWQSGGAFGPLGKTAQSHSECYRSIP